MVEDSQSGRGRVPFGAAIRFRLAAMHFNERGVSPCLSGTESPGFRVMRRPTFASRYGALFTAQSFAFAPASGGVAGSGRPLS